MIVMTDKPAIPELEVCALSKRFRDSTAVQDVSFRIWPGEFVSLLGPSGCGKTTTLRMIAGFVTPDEGQILLRGQDITRFPPHRRKVGLVFQNYALFPHMSVEQNVGFGLRMQRASSSQTRDRVNWALNRVRMSGLEKRRPHELSGGQQQRVAVARVLAAGASLLLLDEPFSNLDAKLRHSMQIELRDLQQQLGVTAIHVTHDQEEAMAVSERLIVMNAGRTEQDGSAEDLYIRPASQFVANFIGYGNRIRGRVQQEQANAEFVRFDIESGATILASRANSSVLTGRIIAFVRPEDVIVGPAGSHPPEKGNVLRGTVRRKVFLGPTTTLHVALNERTELFVKIASNAVSALNLGSSSDTVDIWLPPERIRLLPD